MSERRLPQRTALDDIRVLECGTGVSAPFCTRVLADLGAEVIKVEPPGGDPLRHHGPFPADTPHLERSALFAYLNAGKQSVLLGVSSRTRQELVQRLAASADLLVTNLPAAERERWQVDLEAIIAANPGLVTVVLSELGESGPLSHYRVYEIQVCALAAASIILGEPGRPPLHFPYSLPALHAGLHAAGAALTALLARRRYGHGQRVEVAEVDALATCCGGMALFICGSGGKWRRRGLERHGSIYPSGFYPCQDGFIFIATQTRAQWKGFLQLMGEPDWARDDPALQDGVAIGWRRADEVDLRFIPWLTQHTRRELMEMAREAKLVLGPINAVGELLAEPHLQARKFWTETQIDGTALRLPGMGYTMSVTPWRIGRVPRLGEHTGAVYRPRASRATSKSPPALLSGRPLNGYRAIEFGWNWAGPLVGQIFADLGMEVIKVETRQRMDLMRHWPHARRFFDNANRGKLGIAVNIKKPGGTEVVRRLASHADIVFDNFAAGVMARNGLHYEDLRQVKPDIIVLSMAMAGQTGPLKHLRGFATIATGFAGLESLIGYPDTGPTGMQLLGLGDTNAAIQGVVACLAALWHRECTGEGQFIDLSQVEAAAALVAEPLSDFQLNGRVAGPQGNDHPHMAPHGIYPAAGQDQWVAVAVGNDEEWRALVRIMGAPAWACDESLASVAGRCRQRRELDARLGEWTSQFERDCLADQLQNAGVAAAPVLGIDELHTHPYFRQRPLCQEIESFEGTPALAYSTPWHFTVTAPAVDRPAPKIGEHNDYVFRELLGMSNGEIQALTAQGTIE
ncbi:MAG: CaiB/BaiF CoA transferase family protein [Candidatus Binatia bacterium]